MVQALGKGDEVTTNGGILGKIISQRENGLRIYKTTIISIGDLIEHIDEELNFRK